MKYFTGTKTCFYISSCMIMKEQRITKRKRALRGETTTLAEASRRLSAIAQLLVTFTSDNLDKTPFNDVNVMV